MSRPRRFGQESDPGPVQIQAGKVHFDVADIPLYWIPGHPVAPQVISMPNVILPALERRFVATLNEALPLIKDPKLPDDVRGFIGQEATHADVVVSTVAAPAGHGRTVIMGWRARCRTWRPARACGHRHAACRGRSAATAVPARNR